MQFAEELNVQNVAQVDSTDADMQEKQTSIIVAVHSIWNLCAEKQQLHVVMYHRDR